MEVPKIGETISGNQFKNLYPVGTNISADQFKEKYGGEQKIETAKKEEKTDSFLETAKKVFMAPYQAMAEASIGGAKGILSTLRGVSTVGEKAIKKVMPSELESFFGFEPEKTVAERMITPEMTKAKGAFQQIGKTTEQIGEYMIPVAGEVRALKWLLTPVKSAAEFAGKTALQTGGDIEKTKEAAIIGGVGGMVSPILGGIKKFVSETVPEKLYSQIFKTAVDDLGAAYRTVSKGEALNPTLAKEALNKGLKGSSQNMAVYAFQKLDQIEGQVQKAVTDKTKQIVIENKVAYKNVLKTIKDQFKSTFFSKRATEAGDLIKKLSTKGNNVSMDVVLKMRRFIDKMRNTSSFRLDPTLSAKQEEFKVAADILRKKLSAAGLKGLMGEERFYIQAIDSIISDAAKRMNKNILNLTDIIIGGGGMAGGIPGTGLGAAAAVRGFQQPFTLTNMAQALYNLRKAPSLIDMFKAIPPLTNQ